MAAGARDGLPLGHASKGALDGLQACPYNPHLSAMRLMLMNLASIAHADPTNCVAKLSRPAMLDRQQLS
jgi:hypothetical protein